jgi:hypothetical protein
LRPGQRKPVSGYRTRKTFPRNLAGWLLWAGGGLAVAICIAIFLIIDAGVDTALQRPTRRPQVRLVGTFRHSRERGKRA